MRKDKANNSSQTNKLPNGTYEQNVLIEKRRVLNRKTKNYAKICSETMNAMKRLPRKNDAHIK